MKASKSCLRSIPPTFTSKSSNVPIRCSSSAGSTGRCHYGEQRWRRRFAQRTGTCALSRQVIHRGDEVFRPAERPAPANAAAMISAAEVLALAGGR